MSVNKINISNFRGIEKLSLEISKKNRVICFVGENGSSKTSVLSLIAEAIVSKTKLSFPNFSNENGKRYRVLTTGEIKKNSNFYSVEIDYSQINGRKFNFKKVVGRSNEIEKTEYSDIIKDVSIPLSGFSAHEISTLDALDSSLDFLKLNVFLIRPSNRYENYASEISNDNTNKDALSVRVGFSGQMPYSFLVAHSGDDVQTAILNMLFDSQIGYPDAFLSFRQISSLLTSITGKNFGNIQVTKMPFRQVISSEVGELKSFSQGELDLLVTIVNILKQQLYFYGLYSENDRNTFQINSIFNVPGVVLIDEVDLHLHPKAQESYIQILTNFFPNLQFIITTHSPFIVRGLPRESIVVSLPTGRVISEAFQKMDIDSITRIIFEYRGGFSDKVASNLGDFKRELTSIEPNISKLKEIFQELSDSPTAKDELELYMASYGSSAINKQIKGA